MIAELFKALIAAGIPVAVSSYLLAWWALKNRYFGSVDSIKGLEKEIKRISKAKSNNKKNKKDKKNASDVDELPPRHKMNPVHNKWLSFGGGFYGVVALLTYTVVELGEVRDFVSNLGGFFQMLSNLSIDLIINFVIDSVMNFVIAIAWPFYWINEISSAHIWVWFIAAYAGYWAGTRFALHQAGANIP